MALTVALQMQFSGTAGAWTDVWADVRIGSAPVVARYGIGGNGPLDLIADTGTLTLALDNSAANSGGVAGYYSPDHASARSGFAEGIAVRLVPTYNGTAYYKFRGTLDQIDPLPFTTRERLTYITALDWMDEATKDQISGVATQTGKRADELITTVRNAMTRQPAASDFEAASTQWPYALDTAKDETAAMAELSKIVRSDLGRLMVIGDQAQGGTLRFMDRRAMQAPGSALTTLTNTMQGLRVGRWRKKTYNRVRVTVHPRRVDAAATTVLYALDQSNPPALAAGETITIVGQYRDPAQTATRVGGVDMVTPVSGTDYAMGSGPEDTSLTADLSVTATFGSTSVEFELTNNGTSTGYITLLQARGRGLYDYAPITLTATNAASKTSYGGNTLELDMPYETGTQVGQAMADYWLSYLKDPRLLVDSVSFLAHEGSAALLTAALAREPGDVITLVETLTGLSDDYFINSVQLTFRPKDMIECTWGLSPRYDTGSYWVLGTSTLGTSTILGL